MTHVSRLSVSEPHEVTEAPSTEPGSLGRALARLAPATLIVTLLGFASSVLVARRLGATTMTDAYFLAFSVATFGYLVLLAALRQGAIPKLTELTQGNGGDSFSLGCSELLSATLVTATLISVIVTAIMLAVIPAAAAGPKHLVGLTRQYLVELAPYAVSGAVEGTLAAILAVRGTFALPALLVGSEAVLKGLLVLLVPGLGAQALVLGSLVGNLATVLALWQLVRRRGISLRFVGFRLSPLVRSVLVLAGPLAVGQTVLQLNPLIDRTAAAGLGPGNVTAFELGMRLYGAPAGLVAAILISPLAATWSAQLSTDGWPAVRMSYSRVIAAVTIIVPPLAVSGFLVRHDIVAFVYQSHAYTAVAVSRTADVLGLLFFCLTPAVFFVPLATIFVIRGDSIFPMKVALANAVLNASLDWALRVPFGIAGIAASTAITYAILCAVYFFEAHRRWGSLGLRSVLRPAAVSAASCLAIVTCCVPLVGLSHLGHSRTQQITAAGLVVALALIIHGLFLTIGRVVDIPGLVFKPAQRQMVMTKR
jgi:putative peptidoglycan lipid II flippase